MQPYHLLLVPTLFLPILTPLVTVYAAFPNCTEAPLAGTTVCDTSKDPLTRASALVSLFSFSELVNNTQDVSPGVSRLGIPKIT
jgi:xylan 1,4-beta-xylosidase